MAHLDEAQRRRRLRKYEAAPTPMSRDERPPGLDLLSPFGPLIGRSVAPPALVESLNHFAAAHVRPNRSSEWLLPREAVFPGVGPWIEALVARWVEAADGAPPSRVRLEAAWIVSQYADTASPVHFHDGDVSGVLYLGVPHLDAQSGEEQRTYISGRRAGYLNLMIGGKQRFSKSLISFKPVVGDVYVFPGWLLHGVEPFSGAGERRSLAFNVYVDD